MNLIAPNGLITYSTEHGLIGERPYAHGGHVAAAFAGREIRGVDTTQLDGRRVKVFETYLPVQSKAGNAAPLGLFELYQDYDRGIAAGLPGTRFCLWAASCS